MLFKSVHCSSAQIPNTWVTWILNEWASKIKDYPKREKTLLRRFLKHTYYPFRRNLMSVHFSCFSGNKNGGSTYPWGRLEISLSERYSLKITRKEGNRPWHSVHLDIPTRDVPTQAISTKAISTQGMPPQYVKTHIASKMLGNWDRQ